MNKPVYLGMSILYICKLLMYEFWYEYIKLKYKENAKLCYMDTDSFVINIFTEEILKNGLIHLIMKNDKRPLKIGINKKVIGMFKDER